MKRNETKRTNFLHKSRDQKNRLKKQSLQFLKNKKNNNKNSK